MPGRHLSGRRRIHAAALVLSKLDALTCELHDEEGRMVTLVGYQERDGEAVPVYCTTWRAADR